MTHTIETIFNIFYGQKSVLIYLKKRIFLFFVRLRFMCTTFFLYFYKENTRNEQEKLR